jgi:hypothetical protein
MGALAIDDQVRKKRLQPRRGEGFDHRAVGTDLRDAQEPDPQRACAIRATSGHSAIITPISRTSRASATSRRRRRLKQRAVRAPRPGTWRRRSTDSPGHTVALSDAPLALALFEGRHGRPNDEGVPRHAEGTPRANPMEPTRGQIMRRPVRPTTKCAGVSEGSSRRARPGSSPCPRRALSSGKLGSSAVHTGSS